MHHTATHNIGLGSYNDDFNRLMKDLLMMDHFVKGFYKNRLLQRNGAWLPFQKNIIYSVIITKEWCMAAIPTLKIKNHLFKYLPTEGFYLGTF